MNTLSHLLSVRRTSGATRGVSRWWLAWLVGALCLALSARAQLEPAGAWDGLSELKRVAKDSAIELRVPASFNLSQLAPGDALLIVSPRHALPVQALTTFLREGGRVALLDDLGTGDRLLGAYQVSRSATPASNLPALRGDPSLLIAYPASEHPLVLGVSLLLTNRASELRHPDLKPVFTFGRSGRALVLAGAVGSGRLVAVGDGSLLINQLMTVASHRRFAKNLLEYLARPGGRVWLIQPGSRIEGAYGHEASGLSRVDGWLKRLARPDLPPAVLWLLALALSGIAIVVAAGSLPRRSPYIRPELFPKPNVFAGFAGRVAAAEHEGLNLLWSLLDYKRELEAELAQRLQFTGPFEREEALRRARKLGLANDTAGELAALLQKLELLAAEHAAGEPAQRIRVSELRNVVRKGEELLGKLGNDKA